MASDAWWGSKAIGGVKVKAIGAVGVDTAVDMTVTVGRGVNTLVRAGAIVASAGTQLESATTNAKATHEQFKGFIIETIWFNLFV
jgi:hypothetical protein